MGGFIETHCLWTEDQKRQAAEIRARLERDDIKLVRMAWADPHGASRAKMVHASVLLGALKNGYNINVATSTLDSAGTRTEIAKGLQSPGAIVRLANGSIAVIEGTTTVSVVDPKTGVKRTRATGLKLDTDLIRVPAMTYAGIAAGADGTLYVSAPHENKILKLAP